MIDVATALAALAPARHVRPVVDASLAFAIAGGRQSGRRHRRSSRRRSVRANDCVLSPAADATAGRHFCHHRAEYGGPNRPFLRQNALIVVLAQMGSFVPAQGRAYRRRRPAVLTRRRRRRSRRGHSDLHGRLVETAAILNQPATCVVHPRRDRPRHPRISTGFPIAWATIEHLHESNRCRTFVATHFHEMDRDSPPKLHAACTRSTMRVKNGRARGVLHEVVPGAADRILRHPVAKLAGLPCRA